jgi:hypothetical protein
MEKKVHLLGFPNPVRLKSKKYILSVLYDRAKKNPFIRGLSYDEYLEFITKQIEQIGGVKLESPNEKELYNALKSLGWIRVVNAFIVGIISVNIGIT